MPEYRVVIFGGMDGLLFEDLIVTYSSGHRFPLRIKQGELVPQQIFDPLDIQKSLAVGSLGNYIKAGAVKVEYSDVEQSKRTRKPRAKKEAVKPEPIKQPSAEPVQETPVEVVQQKAEETQSVQQAPTDLSGVNTVENFIKLSFFQKISFIQHSTDKEFLKQLLQKIDSPQLKNNLSHRISEL